MKILYLLLSTTLEGTHIDLRSVVLEIFITVCCDERVNVADGMQLSQHGNNFDSISRYTRNAHAYYVFHVFRWYDVFERTRFACAFLEYATILLRGFWSLLGLHVTRTALSVCIVSLYLIKLADMF